jgi:hypothetical protein
MCAIALASYVLVRDSSSALYRSLSLSLINAVIYRLTTTTRVVTAYACLIGCDNLGIYQYLLILALHLACFDCSIECMCESVHAWNHLEMQRNRKIVMHISCVLSMLCGFSDVMKNSKTQRERKRIFWRCSKPQKKIQIFQHHE